MAYAIGTDKREGTVRSSGGDSKSSTPSRSNPSGSGTRESSHSSTKNTSSPSNSGNQSGGIRSSAPDGRGIDAAEHHYADASNIFGSSSSGSGGGNTQQSAGTMRATGYSVGRGGAPVGGRVTLTAQPESYMSPMTYHTSPSDPYRKIQEAGPSLPPTHYGSNDPMSIFYHPGRNVVQRTAPSLGGYMANRSGSPDDRQREPYTDPFNKLYQDAQSFITQQVGGGRGAPAKPTAGVPLQTLFGLDNDAGIGPSGWRMYSDWVDDPGTRTNSDDWWKNRSGSPDDRHLAPPSMWFGDPPPENVALPDSPFTPEAAPGSIKLHDEPVHPGLLESDTNWLTSGYEKNKARKAAGEVVTPGAVDWGGMWNYLTGASPAPHSTPSKVASNDYRRLTGTGPGNYGLPENYNGEVIDLRLPANGTVTDAATPLDAGNLGLGYGNGIPDDPAVTAIADATGDVPLPRRDPRAGTINDPLFTSNGQVVTSGGTTTTPGRADPSGAFAGAQAGIDAATKDPTVTDKVVDGAGKILSHTALGGIVSTLFPDLWNGMGGGIKDMLNGDGTPAGPVRDMSNWDADRGTWKGNDPDRPAPPAKPATFPDLNHNGIDDRIEGYKGPDTKPGKPETVLWDLPPTRTARFPDMPPYNPGRSDEWTYFTNNHLADGGMVHGYAEGGSIDQSDPRVQLIGETENVLERIKGGEKPDEGAAKTLKAFVAQFGDAALKSLHDNVSGGMTMKSGRLIKGPGGPKDDAVPAVIVEEGTPVSPAKLSNGEFVFPVAAVEGIGEGDIKVGAQRLQELAERLSAQAKGPEQRRPDNIAMRERLAGESFPGYPEGMDPSKRENYRSPMALAEMVEERRRLENGE